MLCGSDISSTIDSEDEIFCIPALQLESIQDDTEWYQQNILVQ
jgi:hypothetical protein